MSTILFSRFPAIAARILLVLIFLPWLGRFQDVSQNQAYPDQPTGGLPSGWTSKDWNQAVSMMTADTWSQKTKQIPEDAVNTVAFGYSVAVQGDTLVVGAINDRFLDTTYGYQYCGSVYVFEKGASGWPGIHLVDKLFPNDPVYVHSFGMSVAIDGNYIVVGAPDSHKAYSGTPGRAYLFTKTTEGWEQSQRLTELNAPSAGTPPRFGFSVAIDGDLIVVGAPDEDLYYDGTMHVQQGSAYVFQIPPGGWAETEVHETGILTPADGQEGDMFGVAVAVSGHTVIASAYAHEPDPNNPDEQAYGKVYLFSHSDPWGDATDTAWFTASDAADHEYFGWSVAFDGDLAVVGAPGDFSKDENGEESVYLFKRPVGGWSGSYTETARLVASDDNMFHDFGTSVSVSGNVVAVGAPGWDTAGSVDKTGGIYIFSEPVGGWVDLLTETRRLLAEDHQTGDEFGHYVALNGSTLAVGVPLENGRFGAAYVFEATPDTHVYLYLPILRK